MLADRLFRTWDDAWIVHVDEHLVVIDKPAGVSSQSPDPELPPTDVQAGPGPFGLRVRFAFGPLRFVYDRLGLRRDASPSTDTTEDIADA